MVEFKQMPKGSLRRETTENSIDVWKTCGMYRGSVVPIVYWKFTVFCNLTRTYIGQGDGISLDEACEAALIMAKA